MVWLLVELPRLHQIRLLYKSPDMTFRSVALLNYQSNIRVAAIVILITIEKLILFNRGDKSKPRHSLAMHTIKKILFYIL